MPDLYQQICEEVNNGRLTPSGENTDMDATYEAEVDEVQCADNIASDRFLFVSLTPINVWATSHTSTVQDVCRFDLVQLTAQSLSVLHANGG